MYVFVHVCENRFSRSIASTFDLIILHSNQFKIVTHYVSYKVGIGKFANVIDECGYS